MIGGCGVWSEIAGGVRAASKALADVPLNSEKVTMSKPDSRWSFTNLGNQAIAVWLEPWADKFLLAPGSTVQLRAPDGSEVGDIEQTEDQITVWASAETIEVFIDDEPQKSVSAIVPAPRSMTKDMLHTVFANQPSARLGGAENPILHPTSLWKRIKARFRS
jgi:hypothetical protein